MTRTWKLISAGAGISAMLAVMGISSFAQFTANGSLNAGSAVPTFQAGTLGISPGSFTGNWTESEVDATDNSMFDAIGNMAPGDTWSQTVTVTNTGSLPEYYQVSVAPSGNLFAEQFTSANGIPSAGGAANVSVAVATASGNTTILGPVDGGLAGNSPSQDGNWVLINPGETETLSVTVALPITANNAYQGQSGTFSIDFNAVQSDNNNSVSGAITNATNASQS